MEVEFAPDEGDLAALARYRMEHSPALRRRFQLRRLMVSGALALAGGLLYVFTSRKAVALYFIALGAFFLAFYPAYYRWLVGRTMREIARARLNPQIVAARKLRVAPGGVELTIGGATQLKAWAQVTGVEVTRDHLFLAFEGDWQVVLPRRRVDGAAFEALVETLRRSTRPT